MKKKLFLGLVFLGSFVSSNAQISTGAGASSILANSSVTNTNLGIGTTTPNGKLEIAALPNGQTFTDFSDSFKKSLLLNVGAFRDGYYRLLTFVDLPSSNISANPSTYFAIEDRNDMNRLRHYAITNGGSSFYLQDKTQTAAFLISEDGTNTFMSLPKPESYVTIGGNAVWPIAHKFWVKTGSSRFEDDVFMNSNVGIGTTNFVDGANTYRLSVKGKIRAEEIKVYNTWADYVFNNDYKLTSLKDVETYIKENGHLKNVPSAKEVTENGLELGEMSKIQQEKIEELTLYLIQQNKEIELLKAQVKTLLERK